MHLQKSTILIKLSFYSNISSQKISISISNFLTNVYFFMKYIFKFAGDWILNNYFIIKLWILRLKTRSLKKTKFLLGRKLINPCWEIAIDGVNKRPFEHFQTKWASFLFHFASGALGRANHRSSLRQKSFCWAFSASGRQWAETRKLFASPPHTRFKMQKGPWIFFFLVRVPIWNDSWQLEEEMRTISNWGIRSSLAMMTGFSAFHSRRSSSIVFETAPKIRIKW